MSGRTNYSRSPAMIGAISEHSANPNKSIMSISQDSDVSYHSLLRRIKGKVAVSASTGRVQGIHRHEEKALVNFAIEMSIRGLGLTRKMLKDSILKIVQHRDHSFGEQGPSDKWMAKFVERNEELSQDSSKAEYIEVFLLDS